MSRIAAIDLFCGAGGLTRGLADAGIHVVAGYDIDPACDYPYSKNNKKRYLALREFVRKELNYIEGKWKNLRNEEGAQKAITLLPPVAAWIGTLPKGARQPAKAMLGKLNTVSIDDDEQRKNLIKTFYYSVRKHAYSRQLAIPE